MNLLTIRVSLSGSQSESDSDWFSPVKAPLSSRHRAPTKSDLSNNQAGAETSLFRSTVVSPGTTQEQVTGRKRMSWRRALHKLMSIGIYRNILGGK